MEHGLPEIGDLHADLDQSQQHERHQGREEEDLEGMNTEAQRIEMMQPSAQRGSRRA